MAAEAHHAPSVREQSVAPRAFSRILAAITPWYDWGRVNAFRLDAHEPDFSDEAEGEVRFLTLQWLGAHVEIQIGRTPKAVR